MKNQKYNKFIQKEPKQKHQIKLLWKLWSGLALIFILMVGCNVFTDDASCSKFFKDGIKFTLGVEPNFILLSEAKGYSNEVLVNRSISNENDTKKRSLRCEIEASITPENLVSVEPIPDSQNYSISFDTTKNVVKNQNQRVAKVTFTAFGKGDPEKDSLWVAVLPEVKESEPVGSNDGPSVAQAIGVADLYSAPSESCTSNNELSCEVIGLIEQEEDVDWYYTKIPANHIYRVTIEPTILSFSEGDVNIETPNYSIGSGVFKLKANTAELSQVNLRTLALNKDNLISIAESNGFNTIFFNDSKLELPLYIEVKGSSPTSGDLQSLDIPYKLLVSTSEQSPDGNTRPIANNDTFGFEESNVINSGVEVELPILKNDRDIDGDLQTSSVKIVEDPLNGSTEISSEGVVVYMSEEGFQGVDTFYYTVADTLGAVSTSAQVKINVVK